MGTDPRHVPHGEDIPWERSPHGPTKEMGRAGMLIDLRRCIGCHSCSISCKSEFDTPLGSFRTRTHWVQSDDDPRLSFVPMMCMQCEDAPCMNACPTEALERKPDGRVEVNADRCDGTAACVPACPYDAIAIHPQTGKAEKCDFCSHRTELGMEPACVEACPTTALRFGDFDDPNDPVTRYGAEQGADGYMAAEGTRPTVQYIGREDWMEQKAKGVQLQPGEQGIVYEQKEGQR